MRCSDADLQTAILALEDVSRRVPAAVWPGGLNDLTHPGLYVWWVDDAGAQDLALGLGHKVREGRIYAGQTGATAWPSGRRFTSTLADRIGRQHIGGNVRGSTFRRTLAGALASSLPLVWLGPKRMTPDSEARLTEWVRKHLDVAVWPVRDRDTLGDLERRALRELDPPLNLEGMSATPLRERLAEMRVRFGAPVV